MGPPDAPVTIVEFSDYECPACRSTHEVVKQVRAAYGDRVQWIYKEYPLRRHKEAFKAAEASHCAEDQGKFWEYQEKLFTAPDLSPDNLVNIAVQLGMSQEKFSPVPSGFKIQAPGGKKRAGRRSGGSGQDPLIYDQRRRVCRRPVAG